MVAHPGTALCPDRLRRLNEPQPLKVWLGPQDRPAGIVWRGRRIVVQKIQDVWRIDDEWWRTEISRIYYQLALANGQIWTVFRDLLIADLKKCWFLQKSSPPRPAAIPVRALVVPSRVAIDEDEQELVAV